MKLNKTFTHCIAMISNKIILVLCVRSLPCMSLLLNVLWFLNMYARWAYEYNRHGFWRKAISVPPPSINKDGPFNAVKKKMTNQLVRASVKYSFIDELQQYSFLAPPPPSPKLNKKYRHDQPFTSPFWFNSFIISCPELQRDYLLPPPHLPPPPKIDKK